MNDVIIEKLLKTEQEKNVRILYACESGSRAWGEKRNDTRYQNTLTHGKNYDAKNMMHTFRLLSMAEEIAVERKVIVQRKDREFLLTIKSGEFEYDDLLKMVDEKLEKMDDLYDRSGLPEAPDINKAETILVNIREQFYKQTI
jgi:hypothetical protein